MERCLAALCAVLAVAVMLTWVYRVYAAVQPVQVAAARCEAASGGEADGRRAAAPCAPAQACPAPCGVATLFSRATAR